MLKSVFKFLSLSFLKYLNLSDLIKLFQAYVILFIQKECNKDRKYSFLYFNYLSFQLENFFRK